MTRRRIGLLGGSFDPVHKAHVALARSAVTTLNLDELRWIPAGAPWQKGDLTPAEHRVAMVQAAIAGEPRMVLDRCEVDRAGATYTIDTVSDLLGPDVDLYLVLGQDQFERLDTWHRWRELLPLVTWVVAARDGRPVQAAPAVAALRPRVATVALAPMPVSATEVRERARRGEALNDLVPPAVARYIAQNRLYQTSHSNEK